MSNNLKIIIILSTIIVLILGLYGLKNSKTNNKYNFKVHFFNVGKADCILISNNDKYIMIDTGEESASSELLTYFRNNNITKLEYLIITHFDKDHVGSAAAIIDNIEISNILQSNCPKESEYYTNYINSLANKNLMAQTISGEMSFILEDLKIVINGPTDIYERNESNNSSLIVSINYDDTNYLFMGDSQNDRIKDYLSEHGSDTYDFIKIPYHGHYQKKLDNLLETVKPSYAVITCSNNEKEDDETIELLNELNIKYYLTRNGSITLLSDGKDITMKQ